MSIFAAPDGSNQPINNLTVQSFRVPAFATTLLWGWGNAAWEQAVIIGLDRVRFPQQLGTFRRTGFLSISEADHARTLTLAGWHKRSGPDGSQPWHASRGRTIGEVASWDDSGGDNDFNDYLVRVAFIRPAIKLSYLPVSSIVTELNLDEVEIVE